jgi:hypothetical protein
VDPIINQLLKENFMQEPQTVPPQNVPAEVRIPFPNEITSRYKVFQGPVSTNKGGGRHHYKIVAFDADGVIDFETEIHFQEGALNQHPHNGVLSIVLLAIMKDHFESFQEGEFANEHTALAIADLDKVIGHVVDRANERAARGVFGKHEK